MTDQWYARAPVGPDPRKYEGGDYGEFKYRRVGDQGIWTFQSEKAMRRFIKDHPGSGETIQIEAPPAPSPTPTYDYSPYHHGYPPADPDCGWDGDQKFSWDRK